MIALKVLILSFIAAKVGAHGYSKSPRSRNFVAKQDGKWSGGTANDPQIETCHHCLNRESGGGCGYTGNHDYNDPRNALGGPMPVNIQETFVRGQEFDFSAVLTAHHKGHFEYKACPIQPGGKATQECFDNHKLEFVKDLLYNAPKDPNYPERAYIPLSGDSTVKDGSNYLYTHRYKLPNDLIGELVLIQWHYVTANSCLPEGYNDYDWPLGWYPGSLSTCGYPLPADGNGTPEQFWNCAEVKITSGSSPVAPPVSTPIAVPTLSPVPPTPAPVLPTSAPVSSPVQPGACPPGLTDYIPTNDCKGYLRCESGSLISEHVCPEGTLFDANMRACNSEQFVDCQSNPTSPMPTTSPVVTPTMLPTSIPTAMPTMPQVPPTTAPTESPVQVVECPSEYTGLIPANGCTVFYHCYYGELVSEVPIDCPEGLLYNSDGLCMCNFNSSS